MLEQKTEARGNVVVMETGGGRDVLVVVKVQQVGVLVDEGLNH